MEDGTAEVPDLTGACIAVSTAGCGTCVGDLCGDALGDPSQGIVNLTDLTKLSGLLKKAKHYNGSYSWVIGDTNVAWPDDACGDIVGDTLSDPPNGKVELVDLTKLSGLLKKANHYNGQYSYVCGDPNI
jgi:hypothetical protein